MNETLPSKHKPLKPGIEEIDGILPTHAPYAELGELPDFRETHNDYLFAIVHLGYCQRSITRTCIKILTSP